MLFFVCRLLLVGCWLRLFVFDCCALVVIRGVLFVFFPVRCVLFVGRCSLFVVRCSLFVGQCLLFVVCCVVVTCAVSVGLSCGLLFAS